MAQTATIYNLSIDLADIDRGVYETLDLRVARQPSETIEYMLMRVFAYCFEYEDGIVMTEGVAAGDEPAVMVRDLTGRITAWIEVGMPDADRLHRGIKLAGRAAVYTEIPVYAFDRSFVDEIAGLLGRRSSFSLSITERELYLEIAGRPFRTTVVEHRIPRQLPG